MNAPFIIAGGGIGGLSAALSLARAGRRVTVLERAHEFGEIGAGIQIAPNAFHCFDALGVGDQARSVAVYIDKLRLMNGLSAEEICHIPLGEDFRARFGNPYAVVHRADLHGLLLAACEAHDKVTLLTDSSVIDFDQDEDGVSVFLGDGQAMEGCALIGADGINSTVRAMMLGDGAPRISGHTTYRSVIPTDSMPEDLRWNAATLWAGPKCHIVHYPLKGWKLFNLVVTYHNDVGEAVSGRPVSKDAVRQGFDHVHPRARQIIEHGEDWKLWVLCDRDPDDRWIDGRVGLLGDAAHPMLQYLAQGACMAMEDGVCLGRSIDAYDRVEDGLKDYAARRFARTARVQVSARLMGDYVYHPAGGMAAMRDSVMTAKSPDDWYEACAWLFSRDAMQIG